MKVLMKQSCSDLALAKPQEQKWKCVEPASHSNEKTIRSTWEWQRWNNHHRHQYNHHPTAILIPTAAFVLVWGHFCICWFWDSKCPSVGPSPDLQLETDATAPGSLTIILLQIFRRFCKTWAPGSVYFIALEHSPITSYPAPEQEEKYVATATFHEQSFHVWKHRWGLMPWEWCSASWTWRSFHMFPLWTERIKYLIDWWIKVLNEYVEVWCILQRVRLAVLALPSTLTKYQA